MTHDTPSHDHQHNIPLWGLFLALSALTAGEVGLFEFWHHMNAIGQPIFPKFVMVILLLVMTLPKAAIVLIFFMHLKFEKPFVVFLAIIPLVFVLICVLPPLTDAVTLRNHGMTYNQDKSLPGYALDHGQHEESTDDNAGH